MQVIGADPEGSVYSGGTGRPYLVEGVGEDFWPTRLRPDGRRRGHRRQRRRLVRDDPAARPRGGPARRRLLRHGRRRRAARRARTCRADDVVVVLLPDSGRGYMSKIFNDDVDELLRLPARRHGETTRRRGAARARPGDLPALVHTHPNETVRDAIEILREYGVSQMPVVKAEPPGHGGRGRRLGQRARPARGAVHRQARTSPTRSRSTWSAPLPLVGAGRAGRRPRASELEDADAIMVVEDGKPVGVLTRADLLGFLAD